MQAVKPATGLIGRLADVIGLLEVTIKQRLVVKGVVQLGDGHRPGVEPAVNHLGYPLHLRITLRAVEGYFIDKGTVQV